MASTRRRVSVLRSTSSSGLIATARRGPSCGDTSGSSTRVFDDLGRRKADLASIVCPQPAAPAAGAAPDLRKGIGRVH